ncbi:ATP-binding protein, partial [Streptomyces sp. NPDC055753]
ACSEVKDYQRIRLDGIPEAVVHGRAVTDLVHLLAELLENATDFSPPQTEARVPAARLPDGRMLIEIHDRGISFTAEGYDIVNQKLAAPPAIMDPSMSTSLGLFVVSRLADPTRYPRPAPPYRRAGRDHRSGHAAQRHRPATRHIT